METMTAPSSGSVPLSEVKLGGSAGPPRPPRPPIPVPASASSLASSAPAAVATSAGGLALTTRANASRIALT